MYSWYGVAFKQKNDRSVQAGTCAYTLVIREHRAAYVILGWRWCLETSNSSCYAVVLNSLRNRTGDLTRTRSSVTRSLPWTQARTRARLRSPCGVQTRGSVDGVCIIQECVCRRYGSERRTIVMHMFRADAMPHTISLPLPLFLVHVRYTFQLRFVSLSLSLFPFLPPRSNALHWFFGCWPTPTPSKNLLYCTLPALEAVSEDLDLFVREVCPLLPPKDLREVGEYREDKLHLRVDVSKRVEERC